MSLTNLKRFVDISYIHIRTRPEFRSGTGSGGIWAGSGPVPVDLASTRPVPQFFSCCIIGFMMNYLHHVPPSVPWLDPCTSPVPILYHVLPVPRLHHVLSSSSRTVSRTTLEFTDCITCSPPVPWLYHVLPSSSQTVSRATLESTKCIMPPPPLATLGQENYLYFHRLLLLLILQITLSTDISA